MFPEGARPGGAGGGGGAPGRWCPGGPGRRGGGPGRRAAGIRPLGAGRGLRPLLRARKRASRAGTRAGSTNPNSATTCGACTGAPLAVRSSMVWTHRLAWGRWRTPCSTREWRNPRSKLV